jgi:hypothetical protein
MNKLSKDPQYPIYRLKLDPKHSDLKILTKELDAVGIRYSKRTKLINSRYEETETPELYGLGVTLNGGFPAWEKGRSTAHSKDGNYIKTPFKTHWTKYEIRDLKDAFILASEKATEYEFELYTTSDQEWDDDRTWDASFGFFSYKKGEKDQIEHITNLSVPHHTKK